MTESRREKKKCLHYSHENSDQSVISTIESSFKQSLWDEVFTFKDVYRRLTIKSLKDNELQNCERDLIYEFNKKNVILGSQKCQMIIIREITDISKYEQACSI
jgi:hypothetical protein